MGKGAAQPWPQTLLPLELPNARILTFGYDAYVANWRGVVSQNRIAGHAMNLLAALAAYRGKNDTVRLDSFATSEAMLTVVGKPTYRLYVS